MANIAIRTEKPIVPSFEFTEPVHMLRDFFRFTPFRELKPFFEPATNFVPSFDVRESKDRFFFVGDLPGVKESDIEITLSGSRLLISGVRKPHEVEENETFYTAERTYGTFQRSFTLPEGFDSEHIVAEFKDGVLTIVVPKLAEMKARKILLKTGPKS